MILVFGSINVDVIVPVPRWPGPGETVLGGDYLLHPGGKGANQALAARCAGSSVMMAGAVGADGFAETALAGLRREGVDLALVRTVARPTGCAAIIVDAAGENRIAVAPGANGCVAAAQVPDASLGPDITLLLQMEVPVAENTALIRRARQHNSRIILNLAPAGPLPPGLPAMIDILVANEAEAVACGLAPGRGAGEARQGLVVTRGAAGAQAWWHDGSRIDVPALPIAAVDTTGAGDTFTGVLAAGLDQGLAPAVALRRAVAAAGLACLARGAQAGMKDRVAIDDAVARLPER
ncbi:MAG: ribokinase [Alphaproteobacteria bacterium]|nr:ribokinase [Alphaproteobacteria bacterium]